MIKVLLIILIVSVPLFFVYERGTGYFFSVHTEAKEVLAQGLILILFCMWLLKSKFEFRMDFLTMPVVAFSLIVCLSAFWAYNPYESLRFIRRWLSHILLYFIIVNNIKVRDVKKLMTAMILTAVVVSAYSIAQYFGFEFSKLCRVLPCGSTMGNSSFVGAFLAGVIPLSIILTVGSGRGRIFYFLMCLVLLAALVVVNSRAAWVGLGGAVAIMLMFGKKWLVMALVLILAIGFLGLNSQVRNRAISMLDFRYSTNRQRIEIWKGTVNMIKDRPFGVGIGNFSLVYPLYQTKKALEACGRDYFVRRTHNEYLNLSSEIGLLGLAAFLWIFFALIKNFRREGAIALGLLGGVLATLITAAFTFNLQVESSALYLWLTIGLCGVYLK